MPFPRAKANLYEHGTHMPLAIRWPAKVKGGRTVDDFASQVDLAPTILAAAGLPIPEAMTGRSLLPTLARDKSGASRVRHRPRLPGPRAAFVLPAEQPRLSLPGDPHGRLSLHPQLQAGPVARRRSQDEKRPGRLSRHRRRTDQVAARRRQRPIRRSKSSSTWPSPSGRPRSCSSSRTIPPRSTTSPPSRPTPPPKPSCVRSSTTSSPRPATPA